MAIPTAHRPRSVDRKTTARLCTPSARKNAGGAILTAALSRWFADRQPWQPGVYMQRSVGRDGYMRWDGSRWYRWHETVDAAARETQATGPMYQSHPWRGLAQKP